MTLDQLNASAREGADAFVQALTGEVAGRMVFAIAVVLVLSVIFGILMAGWIVFSTEVGDERHDRFFSESTRQMRRDARGLRRQA